MFNKINDKFDQEVNRTILILSFATYFLILIWTIIFKLTIPELVAPAIVSLEKGHTVSQNFLYFFSGEWGFSLIDTVVNILAFLPIGLYCPLLFKKFNAKRDLLIAFFLSLFFEVIEGLLRIGSFDPFDILINVLGAGVGLIIFYILKPHTSNRVINYVQLAIVIAFFILAIHAPIRIYKNWDMYAPIFDYELYPYIF